MIMVMLYVLEFICSVILLWSLCTASFSDLVKFPMSFMVGSNVMTNRVDPYCGPVDTEFVADFSEFFRIET